jgi:hypothetical protein
VADPTDLTETIATEAASPQSSAADGQVATGRPIGDLIKAQQFLDARAAMRKRRRGITYTQLTTPGALDDGGQAVAPAGGNFGGGPV